MKRTILGALIACCAAVLVVQNGQAMIASEQYGWYDGMIIGQETTGGGGDRNCGTGTKTQCATQTTTRCTQWVTTAQTGGGTAGPTGGGVNAGYTKTCAVTETTVIYLYYP